MKAVGYIRSKTSLEVRTALVLGTELDQLADQAEN
jgi:hypothetical protein